MSFAQDKILLFCYTNTTGILVLAVVDLLLLACCLLNVFFPHQFSKYIKPHLGAGGLTGCGFCVSTDYWTLASTQGLA